MSDNSWYEKGEFPPIGTKVLYHGKKTEIVAYVYCGEYKKAVYQVLDRSGCGYTGSTAFEPIKTERELAIERMSKDINLLVTNHEMIKNTAGLENSILAKLYDAGYRKNES